MGPIPDGGGEYSWASTATQGRSIDLASVALDVATKLLKNGGNFVVKVFQGDLYDSYVKKVEKHFAYATSYKSQASREQSAEIYVIGKGFLTTSLRKGDIVDVTIDAMGKTGDGIAHVEDFVVFVKGAGVGDKLKVKIRDVKPSFAFGDIVEKLP